MDYSSPRSSIIQNIGLNDPDARVLIHGISKLRIPVNKCTRVLDTWDNKRFATRTNSEFANRPVLHIVLVDLWGTGRLANSEFVLVTNVFLSRVLLYASRCTSVPVHIVLLKRTSITIKRWTGLRRLGPCLHSTGVAKSWANMRSIRAPSSLMRPFLTNPELHRCLLKVSRTHPKCLPSPVLCKMLAVLRTRIGSDGKSV